MSAGLDEAKRRINTGWMIRTTALPNFPWCVYRSDESEYHYFRKESEAQAAYLAATKRRT
jgi:hypothetical protein